MRPLRLPYAPSMRGWDFGAQAAGRGAARLRGRASVDTGSSAGRRRRPATIVDLTRCLKELTNAPRTNLRAVLRENETGEGRGNAAMRRSWAPERHLIWLRSLRSRWNACTSDMEREALWRLCTPQMRQMLETSWALAARDDQLPPTYARNASPWTIWLVLGGRGAGKTRTGAEWIKGMVHGLPWLTRQPIGKIALVGETFADVRDVMIDGPSGLLSIHARHERPVWTATRRRLEWPNGAVALAFSADDPEKPAWPAIRSRLGG